MTASGLDVKLSMGMGLELIKKQLSTSTMKGNWYQVEKIYKEQPETHKARITRSGDTALHMAVLEGKEGLVEQLVNLIQDSTTPAVKALEIANERGNTPLHLAASLGNVRMCKCIAERDPQLIGKRNHDSETPFFLAALHGRKGAFLCLHSILSASGTRESAGYSYSRRNDGETTLHCAISGEHFDLAFQIIHLYKNLVNSFNEKGLSPLHLLASNPSAFPSGSHLRGFEKIIYHCIFVDKLEAQAQHHQPLLEELENEGAAKFPENYRTCINFARLLRKLLYMAGGWLKNTTSEQPSVADSEGQRKPQPFRDNYSTCFELIKLMSKAMLVVVGFGFTEIMKIKKKKEKHVWSVQVMDELLRLTSIYEYEDNGRNPQQTAALEKDGETKPYAVMDGGDVAFNELAVPSFPSKDGSGDDNREDMNKKINRYGDNYLKLEMDTRQMQMWIAAKNGATEMREKILLLPLNVLRTGEGDLNTEISKRETPILVAARHGVVEMVKKLHELFPGAIHDMNSEKKNVVLLVVENRQPHVYKFLLDMKNARDSIFCKVDKDGNSALHLAARLGDHKPWLIPGAALQMQWEIKWYEFVKNSMPLHFFVRFNKHGKTPKDIFTESHVDLVKNGGEWLSNTSQSCSLVAALIATVAFATSSSVPGGFHENNGAPNLENEPTFDLFAISSLVALCFSVTALVMFLAILTSRYQEKDFGTDLPRKLIFGLTSLFISIASMLVSFCAGHFFVLKDKLKYAAFPVYLVTCLPVTFFAIAQFPLYFDLIWATFREIPQRSYKVIPR